MSILAPTADPVAAVVESHRLFSLADAVDGVASLPSTSDRVGRYGNRKRPTKTSSSAGRHVDSSRIPITHEERFSDAELFRLFRVDVVSEGEQTSMGGKHVWRNRGALWNVREYPEFCGDDHSKSPEDTLSPAVSTDPPGSAGRIEALRLFYAAEAPPARGEFPLLEEHAVSPFIGDGE